MRALPLFLLALFVGACTPEPAENQVPITVGYDEVIPTGELENHLMYIDYDADVPPGENIQLMFLNRDGQPTALVGVPVIVEHMTDDRVMFDGPIDKRGMFIPKIRYEQQMQLRFHIPEPGIEFEYYLDLGQYPIFNGDQMALVTILFNLEK